MTCDIWPFYSDLKYSMENQSLHSLLFLPILSIEKQSEVTYSIVLYIYSVEEKSDEVETVRRRGEKQRGNEGRAGRAE
jgi:hypothetical protein